MNHEQTSQREYSIDALRVIAILLMFFYHVSMVFVAEWGWHIKNTDTSHVLLEINFWLSSFRMPLLFLVSGYISSILIKRMDTRAFINLRFKRLIIPTVILTFILVAPQIYFQRKLEGVDMSYTEFYRSFLSFKLWPQGNFHWLHLWFIPYLFFYNLISLPLIKFLHSENKIISSIENWTKKPLSIFIFVFIAIIPYTFLGLHFPASYDFIHDIARHSFFIFFIIAGLFMFRFKHLNELIQQYRQLFFRCAYLAIIMIDIIRWNGWDPANIYQDPEQMPLTYVYLALQNFSAWMWVFTFLAYGRKYLNKKSKLLAYANTAVYPFYILHQTIIVVLAYYVVQTNDATTLKFLFLLFVCFFLCITTYHLFIRPYNWVRFLFGMKNK